MFVDSEFNYSEKSFYHCLKRYLKFRNLDEDIDKKMEEFGDIGDSWNILEKKWVLKALN